MISTLLAGPSQSFAAPEEAYECFSGFLRMEIDHSSTPADQSRVCVQYPSKPRRLLRCDLMAAIMTQSSGVRTGLSNQETLIDLRGLDGYYACTCTQKNCPLFDSSKEFTALRKRQHQDNVL